jgi:hypothetical protein
MLLQQEQGILYWNEVLDLTWANQAWRFPNTRVFSGNQNLAMPHFPGNAGKSSVKRRFNVLRETGLRGECCLQNQVT